MTLFCFTHYYKTNIVLCIPSNGPWSWKLRNLDTHCNILRNTHWLREYLVHMQYSLPSVIQFNYTSTDGCHMSHQALINLTFRTNISHDILIFCIYISHVSSFSTAGYAMEINKYRKISNIWRAKSQELNVFHHGLQFYLRNILKPSAKWRMTM